MLFVNTQNYAHLPENERESAAIADMENEMSKLRHALDIVGLDLSQKKHNFIQVETTNKVDGLHLISVSVEIGEDLTEKEREHFNAFIVELSKRLV